MKKYFVKTLFHGWKEVTNDRFDEFVENLKNFTPNISYEKKDEFIASKTKIIDEGVQTMDDFFTRKTCDRCHRPLTGGRIMSMFDEQCICMECADAERKDPEYQTAVEADHAEIKKGNYNYKGLRAK